VGNIHKWSPETGHSEFHVKLPKHGHSGPNAVWKVIVLKDGKTLVSGDSHGNVLFWDTETGTLVQSFKEHAADVMAVAADESGQTVFSSGVDGVVVKYQLVPTEGKWVYVKKRRQLHTHDVRALATFGDHLASGGVDTVLNICEIDQFTRVPKKLFPYPNRPIVSLAREARLVMYQQTATFDIWKLNAAPGLHPGATSPSGSHILQIIPQLSSNLVCSALTSDGLHIAYSDLKETKLFELKQDGQQYSLKRVPTSSELMPASCLLFSTVTEGKSLLVIGGLDGTVQLVNFTDEENAEVTHTFKQHLTPYAGSNNQKQLRPTTLTTLAMSSDGHWLASGDLNNAVHIFNLDSEKHFSRLPTFESQHSAFAFRPDSSVLLITLVDNSIVALDVSSRPYKPIMNRGPTAVSGKIFHISFNPADQAKAVLVSHNWFWSIDLDRIEPFPSKVRKEQKRKRDYEDIISEKGLTAVKKYEPALLVNFIGNDELVVIERPWDFVLHKLPLALVVPVFGT